MYSTRSSSLSKPWMGTLHAKMVKHMVMGIHHFENPPYTNQLNSLLPSSDPHQLILFLTYIYMYLFWPFIWPRLHPIWHFSGILSAIARHSVRVAPMEPGRLGALRGPCIVQMGVLFLSRHGHMWRCECSLVLVPTGSSLNSGEIPYCFGKVP